MKIILAADPCGLSLKNAITKALREDGHEVYDATPEGTPWFEAARLVGSGIQSGSYMYGMVFCGTGMGVSIIANKHRGVYAALVESYWQARRARAVNNANVLCMGGMVVAETMGVDIARVFVETEYLEGFEGDLRELLADDYRHLLETENKLLNSND